MTNRSETKQISFFTTKEMHKSIKDTAKEKGVTIKDYLLSLHINNTTPQSAENQINRMYDMLRQLTESKAFVIMPNQPQINYTPPHSMKAPSRTDTKLPPRLANYVAAITRTPTREVMKNILLALLDMGEATHIEINQYIGHTSHNQPRPLIRALEDGVIFKETPDNPREPYLYRINPRYLEM